jgi:hypothetical protein
VVLVIAAVVVVAAAAVAVVMLRGRGGAPSAPTPVPAVTTPAVAPPPPPAAATDTARPPAETTAVVVPDVAFIRLIGDFPEDAVFLLDGEEVSGRLIRTTPGQHLVEVSSSEFEAWERRVTVRAGDTLRVFVELELKADTTRSE